MYQLLHKHPPVLLKNTLKYCPVSQNDYTELHYTITQKHTSQASHKHTWATSINFLGPAALWKEKDKDEHKNITRKYQVFTYSPVSLELLITQGDPYSTMYHSVQMCYPPGFTTMTHNYVLLQPTIRCRVDPNPAVSGTCHHTQP